MDTDDKELGKGFTPALWQQKVHIIHDVRTESNLGLGSDLTFTKSNDKAAMRMLHRTVMTTF